jgi:hypothetical protein
VQAASGGLSKILICEQELQPPAFFISEPFLFVGVSRFSCQPQQRSSIDYRVTTRDFIMITSKD